MYFCEECATAFGLHHHWIFWMNHRAWTALGIACQICGDENPEAPSMVWLQFKLDPLLVAIYRARIHHESH